MKSTNLLLNNALAAWNAFGANDYLALEEYGKKVYNHFVHNPLDILNLDSPLLLGKVFHVCLGFQEPDKDIQEVRAENAILCFLQALNSDIVCVHDEAAARLMMLLIQYQRYLYRKVNQACTGEFESPYDIFSMFYNGLPDDMPMAANTKMLFVSYYLYNCIINKAGVINEFVNPSEKDSFEQVKNHILFHCEKFGGYSQQRIAELGKIVLDKICEQIKTDIQLFAEYVKRDAK